MTDMDRIKAAREASPLYHAPPCLSELQGDARTQMLAARDQAARIAYLERFRAPARPSAWQRAVQAVKRVVGGVAA